jgi:hypothetical protein
MSLFNYEEEDREREAAKAKGPGYTSEPCIHCKRIRVYERNDGQFICEKCERFQTPDGLSDRPSEGTKP